MKNIKFELTSPVSTSFRCQKACNSLDIDIKKKSIHSMDIDVDIKTPYKIGVIVGASGSGKTTLAEHIWGKDIFESLLDLSKPVIDQFDKKYSYDQCAQFLNGIGLTSVPCWVRPANTLSNGQRTRAEFALQLASSKKFIVIDEWTSVVDRTVAKVMSHCLQKFTRKTEDRKVVLLSCHYDVLPWLNPDWVIDCNKQKFTDRRSLWPSYQRKEKLDFEIKEIDSKSWRYFSHYHYLSDNLPGGKTAYYGLFHNGEQIGFQCFANYVPFNRKIMNKQIMHSNRTVIHPDYAGLGLGIKLITETSHLMQAKGYKVMAKFSSVPVYKAMLRDPLWGLREAKRNYKVQVGGSMDRKSGFRTKVVTFSFEFLGGKNVQPVRTRPQKSSSAVVQGRKTVRRRADVQ